MKKVKPLIEINSKNQIPKFANEAEEREFWQTHSFGPGLVVSKPDDFPFALPATKPRPASTKATSIRLGNDLERRLKLVANKKGMPYQTLLKEFVIERTYEEEKRLGLIK